MNQRRKINYSKKNYTNPFFRKKRKINVSYNKISSRNKIIAMIIVLAFVFMLFYLLFSKKFSIVNLEINGLIRIPKDEVELIVNKTLEQKIYLLGSMRNIILLDKSRIINNINSELFFENLEVKKRFPNSLIINIQEKSQSVIWCENEKYYFADIDGYLINELNTLDIKENNFPIIENKSKYLADGNKISVDDISSKFNFVIDLNNSFVNVNNYIKLEKEVELVVEKYVLTNELDTINLKIIDGPSLYFNIKETQGKQLEKLKIIINEKLKEDFFNKEYIDLRYGERVYYR